MMPHHDSLWLWLLLAFAGYLYFIYHQITNPLPVRLRVLVCAAMLILCWVAAMQLRSH